MPPKLEKFFVPALISAVKTHGEIWDFTHLHYNNNQVLLDTWDQLGKLFNLSGNDVRTKWKNLRDTYRKCYTRHRETGQPIRWPYYKSLNFLNVTYPGKKNKKIAIKEESFDKAEMEIENPQSLNCTVDNIFSPKIEEPFQYHVSEKDDTILEYPFDESAHIENDFTLDTDFTLPNQNNIKDNSQVQTLNENLVQNLEQTNDLKIKTEPVDEIVEIIIPDEMENVKPEEIDTAIDDEMEHVIHEEIQEPIKIENETISTTTREIKPNEDELKAFLLALLPEVEPMNRKQMRIFKQEVSNLVKTILDK